MFYKQNYTLTINTLPSAAQPQLEVEYNHDIALELNQFSPNEFSPYTQMSATSKGVSTVEIRGTNHNVPPSWKGRINQDGHLILANLHFKVAIVVKDIKMFNPMGYFDLSNLDYMEHHDPDELRRFIVYIESGLHYQEITCLMNSDIDVLVDKVTSGAGRMMRLKEILKEGTLSPIVKGESGEHIIEEPLHGFASTVSDLLVLRGANILEFLYNIGEAKKKYTQTQTTQTQATQTQATQTQATQTQAIQEEEDEEDDKKPAASTIPRVSLGAQNMDDEEDVRFDVDNDEEMEEKPAAAEDEEEIVETPLQPDNISTNEHMCAQCLELTEEEGKECKDGCYSSFCPGCASMCLDKDGTCFQCSDKFEETTKYELDRERAKNVEEVGINRLIPNNIAELANQLSPTGMKGLELLFKRVNDIGESYLNIYKGSESSKKTSVHSQLEIVLLLLMIGNVLRQQCMSSERVKDLLRQYLRAVPRAKTTDGMKDVVKILIKEVCEKIDPNEPRSMFGIQPQSDGIAKGKVTCKGMYGENIDFSVKATGIPFFFEAYFYGKKPGHDLQLQIDPEVKVIILVEKNAFIESLDHARITEKGILAQEASNSSALWISGRGTHGFAPLGFIIAIIGSALQMESPPRLVICGDMNLPGYRIMDRVYEKCKVRLQREVPLLLLLLYQDMCGRHLITSDERLSEDDRRELKDFVDKSSWLKDFPDIKKKVAAMKAFVNMERLYNAENHHDMTTIILDELKYQLNFDLYQYASL